MKKVLYAVFAGALLAIASPALAAMQITEWMYNSLVSGAPEFVEFTDAGAAAIDMAGWSFDDSSRAPDSQVLSAFGVVQPGESVVLAEGPEADFRTKWSLPASVKVIGGNVHNLSRADEINLYDAADALVDRLTYDDQTMPGTPRTQGRSGGPETLAALGANNAALWDFVDSGAGDPYHIGFRSSTDNDTGNPGAFVPEPAAMSLLALAAVAFLRRSRTSCV